MKTGTRRTNNNNKIHTNLSKSVSSMSQTGRKTNTYTPPSNTQNITKSIKANRQTTTKTKHTHPTYNKQNELCLSLDEKHKQKQAKTWTLFSFFCLLAFARKRKDKLTKPVHMGKGLSKLQQASSETLEEITKKQ